MATPDPYGLIGRQKAAYGQSPSGQLQGILQQGQGLGFLNPAGSPALQEMIRQQGIRNYRNQLQRGRGLTSLLGLSPSEQQGAQLGFEQQAGGDLANNLFGSGLQEQLGNRDYFRQLFGGALDFQRQQMLQRQAAQQAKQQQGASFLGGLGNLAGSALLGGIPGLGSLFGGVGNPASFLMHFPGNPYGGGG